MILESARKDGESICEHNALEARASNAAGRASASTTAREAVVSNAAGRAQVALLLPPLLPECWWWLGMVVPVEKQMVAHETSVLLLEGDSKLN